MTRKKLAEAIRDKSILIGKDMGDAVATDSYISVKTVFGLLDMLCKGGCGTVLEHGLSKYCVSCRIGQYERAQKRFQKRRTK